MYIFANIDGYTSAKAPTIREDSTGRMFVFARATASCTAMVPKLAYFDNNGYRVTAIFDSGATVGSAALGLQRYYAAVPADQVPSDSDGWFQIGGPCISVTPGVSLSGTTGNAFRLVDATWSIGTAQSATGATELLDVFGTIMATASGGTYDIYLIPKLGIGST